MRGREGEGRRASLPHWAPHLEDQHPTLMASFVLNCFQNFISKHGHAESQGFDQNWGGTVFSPNHWGLRALQGEQAKEVHASPPTSYFAIVINKH